MELIINRISAIILQLIQNGITCYVVTFIDCVEFCWRRCYNMAGNNVSTHSSSFWKTHSAAGNLTINVALCLLQKKIVIIYQFERGALFTCQSFIRIHGCKKKCMQFKASFSKQGWINDLRLLSCLAEPKASRGRELHTSLHGNTKHNVLKEVPPLKNYAI